MPTCEALEDRVLSMNGSTALLPCKPKGYPQPEVKWSKINSTLPIGRYSITGEGLLIENITLEDSGNYEVVLTSSVGTFTYVINLISKYRIFVLNLL